jgi:hypothetical protein
LLRNSGAVAQGDIEFLRGVYEEWGRGDFSRDFLAPFQFGSMPRPETAGPLFDGMSADPAAEQDFRDVLCRTVNPRELLSKERLDRWFEHAEAPAG